VRSFAIDRLACDAGAWTELRLRHASHFARLVQTLDLREEHPDPAALRQAALEIENLVDAWRHAVALGRPALWEPLAEALALHFEIHARYREGAEVLALCPLAAADAAAPQQRAAARVAVLRARLLHWADNDRADQLALAAAQICDRVDDDAGRIAAWRVRAVIAWRRGDATSAITIYRRALALCDSSGHAGKQAMLLDGLGLALIHAGDADASHAAFSRALELNEASGNGLQRVHNLVNLALDTQVRSPPQAMALARRALALAEEIGFDHYIPHCLTTLALAHLAAGDAVASRRLAGRAVAITHQSGDTYIESWAQAALARACLADGLWVDAANALVRGLDVSWRQRELGLVTQHLALAAEWLLQRGRFAAAHAVVHTLLAEAAVPSWLRHSLQALQARLPQAADAPRRQTLAALLHQLLGELAPPAPLS
jgi:tetratricopeptide (TPR) repeat protein